MSSELIALNYHLNRLVEQMMHEPKSWLVHYNREKDIYEVKDTCVDALVVVDYMRRNKYDTVSCGLFKLTDVKDFVFTTYILSSTEPEVVYDKAKGIDKTDKMGRPSFFDLMAQRESARKEAEEPCEANNWNSSVIGQCSGCNGKNMSICRKKKLCEACDTWAYLQAP